MSSMLGVMALRPAAAAAEILVEDCWLGGLGVMLLALGRDPY